VSPSVRAAAIPSDAAGVVIVSRSLS
jgi:hypothetical protein